MSSPHLMLADIGSDKSFAVRPFTEKLNDCLWFKYAWILFDGEPVFTVPRPDLLQPIVPLYRRWGSFQKAVQCLFQISDNGDIDFYIFADFRRIDINVRLFGPR